MAHQAGRQCCAGPAARPQTGFAGPATNMVGNLFSSPRSGSPKWWFPILEFRSKPRPQFPNRHRPAVDVDPKPLIRFGAACRLVLAHENDMTGMPQFINPRRDTWAGSPQCVCVRHHQAQVLSATNRAIQKRGAQCADQAPRPPPSRYNLSTPLCLDHFGSLNIYSPKSHCPSTLHSAARRQMRCIGDEKYFAVWRAFRRIERAGCLI